jgi:hypothetical protein
MPRVTLGFGDLMYNLRHDAADKDLRAAQEVAVQGAQSPLAVAELPGHPPALAWFGTCLTPPPGPSSPA